MTNSTVTNIKCDINPPTCECGCGTPLKPITRSYRYGNRLFHRGEYLRFIRSHLNHVHESRLWEYMCSKSSIVGDCRIWKGRSDERRGSIMFRGKKREVHIISWIFHNGPIEKGLCVMHQCDNPRCFEPRHLLIGTQKQNMEDAAQKGRICCGEKSHHARLTTDQVLEIISLRRSGTPADIVADRFGISRNYVNCLARGESWKHLHQPKVELQWKAKPKFFRHRDEILSLRSSGKTFSEIGRILGATAEGVSDYLRRHPPQ